MIDEGSLRCTCNRPGKIFGTRKKNAHAAWLRIRYSTNDVGRPEKEEMLGAFKFVHFDARNTSSYNKATGATSSHCARVRYCRISREVEGQSRRVRHGSRVWRVGVDVQHAAVGFLHRRDGVHGLDSTGRLSGLFWPSTPRSEH